MWWLRRRERELQKAAEEYARIHEQILQARLNMARSMTPSQRAEAQKQADEDYEWRKHRRRKQARHTAHNTSTGSNSFRWDRAPTGSNEYTGPGGGSSSNGLWNDLDYRD